MLLLKSHILQPPTSSLSKRSPMNDYAHECSWTWMGWSRVAGQVWEEGCGLWQFEQWPCVQGGETLSLKLPLLAFHLSTDQFKSEPLANKVVDLCLPSNTTSCQNAARIRTIGHGKVKRNLTLVVCLTTHLISQRKRECVFFCFFLAVSAACHREQLRVKTHARSFLKCI